MAFVPSAVASNEQFVVEDGELGKGYSPIADLKWPQHKGWIAGLSLSQKQVWYAAQDPQDLIELDANTKRPDASAQFDEKDYGKRSDFRRWWYWHYILPLRAKRLVYKLKFW